MEKTKIDDILSKAQVTVAKKALKDAVLTKLNQEIELEAVRVARRFVKEHKAEITKELQTLFAKGLKTDYDRIIKEAVKRSAVYIDDKW